MSERKNTNLRIPQHQLDQITKAAAQRGLSRTDYMIRAATGELEATAEDTLQRLDALETAVKRLEELAYAIA